MSGGLKRVKADLCVGVSSREEVENAHTGQEWGPVSLTLHCTPLRHRAICPLKVQHSTSVNDGKLQEVPVSATQQLI